MPTSHLEVVQLVSAQPARSAPARRSRRQRGQSLVEFGLSASLLLLLLGGLTDLTRVFYFSSGLQGAAYSAARHAAWFDPAGKQNPYLDDVDITTSVNQGLNGAHMTPVCSTSGCDGVQGSCPTPSDGNTQHNPPFSSSAYPTTAGATYLYVCYTKPDGTTVGSLTAPNYPPSTFDATWHLGQVNVILLFNYGLATGFMQNVLQAAGGIHVSVNAHFSIQGAS